LMGAAVTFGTARRGLGV